MTIHSFFWGDISMTWLILKDIMNFTNKALGRQLCNISIFKFSSKEGWNANLVILKLILFLKTPKNYIRSLPIEALLWIWTSTRRERERECKIICIGLKFSFSFSEDKY